jgi:MFS family permease
MIMSFGLGFVFVGVNTAANAGVPADKAGLAAALVNTSTWLGGALGLGIFSVIATSRTNDLLADHVGHPDAPTSGFRRALVACSVFLLGAALIALRSTNTRGEPAAGAVLEAVPATEET